VHEFRPLSQADVWQLLRNGWGPLGSSLPRETMIDESPRHGDSRFGGEVPGAVPAASADQPRHGNQPVEKGHA
jgi:hypothetical protein